MTDISVRTSLELGEGHTAVEHKYEVGENHFFFFFCETKKLFSTDTKFIEEDKINNNILVNAHNQSNQSNLGHQNVSIIFDGLRFNNPFSFHCLTE